MYMLATLAILGPPLCLIALFSQVSPAAPAVLRMLAPVPRWPGYVLFVVAAISISLPLWVRQRRSPQTFWATWWTVWGMTVAACALILPYHPCFALAVLTGMGPTLLYPLRKLVYPGVDAAAWFRAAAMAATLAAVTCLAVWLWWVSLGFPGRQRWTDWPADFRSLVKSKVITWKLAFVAWVLPLGCAGEMGLAALLCWVRWRHLDELSTRGEHNTEEGAFVVHAARQMAVWLMALMMLVWMSASVNATSERQFNQEKDDMRQEALGVALWAFAALSIWVLDTLGPGNCSDKIKQSKFVQEANKLMQQDWPRAFILLVAAFPMALCAAAYALLRSLPAGDSRPEAANSKPGRLLRLAAEWRWSSVIVKAQLLGLIVVACVVGIAKVTTVFLVMVNEYLSGWPVFAVSAIMFLIGFVLFMCPTSPGPPIYMVMSIVIVSSALRQGWGFEVALTWATFVTFAMKMAFTAAAQKWIGETFSTNDEVRRCIGIHTPYMRAVEEILSAPGLTVAKVTVLVGGPDWPVAVLCGLLRLSVPQIQLGISPVLLQSVFPCVLSGALLLTESSKGNREGHGLTEISLVIASALQLGVGTVAFFCVTEVLERDYEQLAVPRPEDARLVEMEDRAAAQDRAFWHEAAWDLLPWPIKLLLVCGFICMEGCLLVLVGPWDAVFGMPCFKPFDLMSSIERDLGGSPWAIIEPLGWAALVMAVVSAVSTFVFYTWVGVHVRVRIGATSSRGITDELEHEGRRIL